MVAKKIRNTLIAVGLTLCASQGHAGRLSDALVSVLEEHAAMKWESEITRDNSEILKEVRLDFKDGKVFFIKEMTIGLNGKAFDLDMLDVNMRPRGKTLLLRANAIKFTGGPRQIQHILDGQVFSATCGMTGSARLEIDDLGYIDAAPAGSIEEDSKYRIKDVVLEQSNSGSVEACRSEFDLTLKNVDFRPSGQGQIVSESTNLKLALPGSLASLAADRSQIATLSMQTKGTGRKIIGGASAWSILNGSGSYQVEAISLVPAITYGLRHRENTIDSRYLMEFWNTMTGSRFIFTYAIDRATMRTANVLDPQMVTRFEDAGLTTMLMSSEGTISAEKGALSLDALIDITGIADARLRGDFMIETYPDSAISLQEINPSLANGMLPLKVIDLSYEHTDEGFNDAIEDIIGIQTTVRIGQLRDQYAATLTGRPAQYVRDIATKAASFISRGVQWPPAVIDITVNPQVNMREALIIMGKAPEQIVNILDFDVYSREQ